MSGERVVKHWWRDYRTASGQRPIRDFLYTIPDADRREILAIMKNVAEMGLSRARHVRGELYEVRASGERQIYRVLFAPQGKRGNVLLSLHAFSKKSQKTPVQDIAVAERRLADWRSRAT